MLRVTFDNNQHLFDNQVGFLLSSIVSLDLDAALARDTICYQFFLDCLP